MKLQCIIYFVHCHLCSDFFTFLYFGISFSSHSLHRFLTLFFDVLDLSSSILKFSFFPFNKLGEEMQYINLFMQCTHTITENDTQTMQNLKMANCTIMHVSLGSYHSHLAAEGVEL